MFAQERHAIELLIRSYTETKGFSTAASFSWNPIPFSGEWGISTSFFQFAALEARRRAERGEPRPNVAELAQQIAQGVVDHIGMPEGFHRVEAVKGYLNLYFSSSEFSRRVVKNVLTGGKSFGRGEQKNQQVMVEFSQPNTHKAFHVGHLRSAILGDALCRILDFAGYEVVRANYFGDIGLHVIKWLWNYLKHHNGEKPEKDVTQWMGNLYAEANRRLEENPELEAEVRALYARWDRQEPEIVEVWQRTRQWSIDGFMQLYDVLDICFDELYSNSMVEHPGKEMVDELIRKGIAVDERPEGPVIVRIDDLLGLKKEKYRVYVVLRSDSTALYSTEDLALAVKKFSDYGLAKSIYVVDVRQSLHFQQLFKTLELAGYPWADRLFHLAYEIVNLPGNVIMASREGTVVLLETLIREAVHRALEVVHEKNPELEEQRKQSVAKAVGIGALKFPMLARDSAKIVTFDWEAALDFNGQAAPYIQYAHVRANSILRKAREEGIDLTLEAAFDYPLAPTEVQLVDWISRIPGEIQRAAEEYRTLHITNLAYELARAFNDFYSQCPVLKAEPDVRLARLKLVDASRQAIFNLLGILGIEAPEVM